MWTELSCEAGQDMFMTLDATALIFQLYVVTAILPRWRSNQTKACVAVSHLFWSPSWTILTILSKGQRHIWVHLYACDLIDPINHFNRPPIHQ